MKGKAEFYKQKFLFSQEIFFSFLLFKDILKINLMIFFTWILIWIPHILWIRIQSIQIHITAYDMASAFGESNFSLYCELFL